MFISTEYLFALLAILAVNLVYFYYTKIYKFQKFFKDIPTPPKRFFLGNALDFRSSSEFFSKVREYIDQYGSLVHMKIGPFGRLLLCSDYNFIQFVLNNNKSFTKSKNFRFLKDWVGYGLISLEGNVWRRHRKILTPAFHFKILERFVSTFNSAGDILVEKLSEACKPQVDIHPYITRCTLDVIYETAMGTKIDAQNNEQSHYLKSVKEMSRIFIDRTVSLLKSNDLYYRFTKDYEIEKESLKYLYEQTNKVIESKAKELKEKYAQEEDDKKKKKVFIDIMLEDTELSEIELKHEVNAFMFGGHDTTATGTSFVLYCLSQNKEVQDKVLNEQKQLFGNEKNPEVTYSNLQEMKYLDAVIKESMRLYSPVPVFGRQTAEDTEYEGKIIPKGVVILICPIGIHMNPKYYPEPEKFDPSRFETADGKLPYAYIPFSAGPRNCIGQKYAMLEMKCLVSKVVRNFELTPANPEHKMELAAELVLKSLNGIKVGLKKR